MGDECLFAEVGDVDFPLAGEPVFGRDDQGELVFEDFGGLQLRVARNVGDGAEIEAVVEDFEGNVAGKHAMDADLHAGMFLRKMASAGSSAWMELSLTPRESSPRRRGLRARTGPLNLRREG